MHVLQVLGFAFINDQEMEPTTKKKPKKAKSKYNTKYYKSFAEIVPEANKIGIIGNLFKSVDGLLLMTNFEYDFIDISKYKCHIDKPRFENDEFYITNETIQWLKAKQIL